MATRRGQRSARWISALVVFFCAAAAAPAAREYRTEDVGTLRITIDTDWAPRSAPGYLPARFEITNMGDARVIEIIAQGSRVFVGRTRGAGSGSTITRQSVRLAMGDRVKVTMPVPIYADSESLRFEIQERGRLLLRFNYSGFQSRAALHDASALVVAAAGSPTSGVGLRTARVPAGRSTPAPTLDFVLEPSRLPSNWLGYTSLRAVVIGPIEWGQMSDGQKSALLTWTASGGDLIFVNGEIKTLVPSAKLQPGVNPDRMIARHLFGRIHALNLTSFGTAAPRHSGCHAGLKSPPSPATSSRSNDRCSRMRQDCGATCCRFDSSHQISSRPRQAQARGNQLHRHCPCHHA